MRIPGATVMLVLLGCAGSSSSPGGSSGTGSTSSGGSSGVASSAGSLGASSVMDGSSGGGSSSGTSTTAHGHVLFHSMFGGFQWVEARDGAIPVALDGRFDAVSPGTDEKMGLSRNASWAVVDATRFGCDAFACLARIRMDGLGGEKIAAGGMDQHVYTTRPAISDDGTVVVFTQLGPNGAGVDLVVTRRTGTTWSAPTVLTTGSPRAFHRFPVLSGDGTAAYCDCGLDSDDARNNSICRVPTEGSGVTVLAAPADIPGGVNLHHPWPLQDGTVLFEGEGDGGEALWRLAPGGTPQRISTAYSNDNTPCVLPDGYVASLWLERPGNVLGIHELKLMDPTGADLIMVVAGVDITDLGLFCGR